ncbi:hypothetical protein [Flavobacterium agrisoli]|uniref:Uncharacterized protein n=1 Tax=Flavobacterium agrisoli TaxID=2793066 RepID=A0A934UKZ7_9FLAO|nr:hypothetical protein [Flavobacterium agrisoli]MBK0370965.1 hypothetical protein [Flavobacterium agrisoli]
MKTKFLLVLLLISSFSFAQSINDYKAVIVPLKFDFLKSENQYRLATLTKYYLQQAGFTVYYSNEELPQEYYGHRCSLLNADVVKDNAFLTTKLFVVFKDCYGKTVYTSETGKSKIKEYEPAYKEALEGAFVSIKELNYQYNGKVTKDEVVANGMPPKAAANGNQSVVTTAPVAAPAVAVARVPMISSNSNSANMLYAQPTETGYQLIDKTPKVVMKLMKTSQPNSFIAVKDGVQGSLNLKDNKWIFEYYKDDKLISETIDVKF